MIIAGKLPQTMVRLDHRCACPSLASKPRRQCRSQSHDDADLQGSRACRPEAADRCGRRGARRGRASSGDPCRDPFYRWARPEIRLDRRRCGVGRACLAVGRRGSRRRSPGTRSSKACARCGTTTGASPGCSTAGWNKACGRCRTTPFRSTFSCKTGEKFRWRRYWRSAGRGSRSCSITAASRTSPTMLSILGRVTLTNSRRCPNVVCKLSGLLNCARPGASAADVEIYAKHVLAAFGPSRVMWASDWPPLDLASDYATWKRISNSVLQPLPSAQAALL